MLQLNRYLTDSKQLGLLMSDIIGDVLFARLEVLDENIAGSTDLSKKLNMLNLSMIGKTVIWE